MTPAPVSAVLGTVATAPFAVLKRFRPHRPIHTEGVGLEGTLLRTGGASGIRWIDEPGQDPVRARFSRSFGFPHGWPDILGLALRVPGAEPGDRADVLLATAGEGRLSRFVPTFHRRVPESAFASFMPYRGDRGPVLVAARPEPREQPLATSPDRFRQSLAGNPWVLDLLWATPTGPWQRFGTLELRPGAPFGPDERFDPLLNVPVGARNYGWTHRLREPSYTLARTPRERPGRA
ncbi:hypothetical protein LQU92_03540 [Kocuria sp. LUK]|uniref:hypothetical protein n=1 Tax=Kocuria sp. LUK TaxID=2897828 RepID=UPI001E42FA29|nr:hypothetical protein [Kocuria sp. LUK]MCD1144315.1 hypothetical protein [Kocuria sp. LUK]